MVGYDRQRKPSTRTRMGFTPPSPHHYIRNNRGSIFLVALPTQQKKKIVLGISSRFACMPLENEHKERQVRTRDLL